MSDFWNGALFGAFATWLASAWVSFIRGELEGYFTQRARLNQFRDLPMTLIPRAEAQTDVSQAGQAATASSARRATTAARDASPSRFRTASSCAMTAAGSSTARTSRRGADDADRALRGAL